jgi:osmotically-inducible protein OsmY
MLDQLSPTKYSNGFLPSSKLVEKTSEPSEKLILSEVHHHLATRGYEELRSIRGEFHEGMLILRGQLSSHYLKQLAQEAVRGLPGVKMIVNATEVLIPGLQEFRPLESMPSKRPR